MSAIRHIRQSVFKMTQTAFAEETDIAQSTLSRWELGAEPTLEGVRKIRAAALRRGLGWDEDWFLLPADDGPCRQPDAAMPRARGTQDIPTPSEPVPADGFGCAERGLINPPELWRTSRLQRSGPARLLPFCHRTAHPSDSKEASWPSSWNDLTQAPWTTVPTR